MSTNYGLKCLDCDKSIVPESLGSYAINDVLKGVSALANLWRAAMAVREIGTLDVDLSAYWCPERFHDLLDFVAEHHQHNLVVIDEYGHEGAP